MDSNELKLRINSITDKVDKVVLQKELKIIFSGMQKIGEGFLDIAQSANRIKVKKLYRQLGFNTFEIFCNQVLGLTRKTVYLYLRISDIVNDFPSLLPSVKVIQLGTKKMDIVIAGVNRINTLQIPKEKKLKKITTILKEVEPSMVSGEIDELVRKYSL